MNTTLPKFGFGVSNYYKKYSDSEYKINIQVLKKRMKLKNNAVNNFQ